MASLCVASLRAASLASCASASSAFTSSAFASSCASTSAYVLACSHALLASPTSSSLSASIFASASSSASLAQAPVEVAYVPAAASDAPSLLFLLVLLILHQWSTHSETVFLPEPQKA
eukprot:TRINITY_DN13700_c0_g1_i1.p1 TRINITY_DN13700_c0_g1~~TRINITY_DN13700_c0_g1_i1.p1  ORF type:complete len:128 (-),score=20.11 TRINITY_DN13700_c0_g1_i1:41-394(-)